MTRALYGRDGELERVRTWLAARLSTRPDGPPALLVSGEAGVGKTSLVEAVLDGAGPAAVARAAGTPWRGRAFGLLRDALDTAGSVPESGGPDTGPLDADDVARTLIAAQPVLLVLDDLQWSDDASLELLPRLVDALAGQRAAVLLAYRGDELPRAHLLRRVRAQLRQRRLMSELALSPLDGGALAELVKELAGGAPAPALVDVVGERTEGLPFFVEELVAALRDSGRLIEVDGSIGLASDDRLPLPESVRDAVALRLAGISDRARAGLEVAALLGSDVDVELVAAVTGAPWPDELDSCGVLVGGPGAVRRFRHVLVPEAVRADIPWSRRRSVHLAIAGCLSGVPDAEAAVARHLLAAHEPHRARPALLAAAAACLRARAYRDAARWLDTAIESWPAASDEASRLAAVDELAQCWELCGEHAAAIAALRELAEAADDPSAYRRLAIQHELLGQWPPALSARESAARSFAAAGRADEAAAERLAIAAHLRSAASFDAALHTVGRAREDAAAADRVDLICRADALRGNILARMGRGAEGVSTVRDALERALASGLGAPAAEIYQRLADSIEHAGDYRNALQTYDTAYEFCQLRDLDTVGQLCRACATVVLFHAGRWDTALEACREVLDESASTPHARAVATAVVGLVRAMRGQAAPARAALLDARAIATNIDLVAVELLATWGLALLDEASGQLERARDAYRHVVGRCRQTDERHYSIPVLQFAAARFAHDGARADLAATTELLADAVTRTGQREARAALSFALAEAALAEPEREAAARALPHLRRSDRELAQLDLPIVHALVQHRIAVVAAEVDPAASARAFQNAYRTAQQLRCRNLTQRIAADADRLGRPGAEPRTAVGLTPREHEVLSLVSTGLTSREIARQLHLSVRTVEMHVRNAAATLGCRTRAEAVRRLITAET